MLKIRSNKTSHKKPVIKNYSNSLFETNDDYLESKVVKSSFNGKYIE